MTGLELTNRLVEDIKKAIQAKSIARSQEQLLADLKTYAHDPSFEINDSIEESWISLTCDISFPSDLAVFTQFINSIETEPLINYTKDSKIEMPNYLLQLENNKQKIADGFQKIKDHKNLRFVSGNVSKPFFDLLKERLDYIHEDATSVDKCYNSLIAKRKK